MIRPIAADQLAELVASGLADPDVPGGKAYVFDLREAEAFRAGHVPGARHVPGQLYPIRWIPQTAETHALVVLIDSRGEPGGTARHVAHELAEQWFRRLRYLSGGFDAWQAAGHPVEEGGPAGTGAASADGTLEKYKLSGAAPWRVPKVEKFPDLTGPD
jgi:rhodanese-related sulfurtransferase